VATYSSFIDAPSVSPGEWLKEEFESRVDAELEWATPDNEVNHYVERAASGASIDADLYVGLNTEDLVRVDEELEDDLFAERGDVDGFDDVREGLLFDPFDRAVPFDTGYVSLVYDGTETEAPETFEGLLDEEHRGALIAQNPGASSTGRSFLLHTVHRFGDGGVAGDGDGETVEGGDDDTEYDYLDYWEELQANEVRVLGSWDDAYAAWSEGEAPMVVSYSTDQVFADMEGEDLEEHQIRFLNDQAYANPEGMAVFADADEPELAREFMSFVLEPEVQGEIAQRNVAFPATDTAELPDDYAELAQEPDEPVTFTYDELQGSVSEWVEAWERQFAEN
ncbi:extracellular solute-binding protein, partial [Halorubrum sp. AD140]|uniref:thiamine ABC transporter substrate-binding protein n=1 Tax=Halorubrum sp. AD140 TaxID=3050073 RepID=UPI002ACCAAF2